MFDEATFKPGEIFSYVEREGVFYLVYNLETITAKNNQPFDITPPEFELEVNENTLTVNVTDNDVLYKTPYSFDYGKTWQEENNFIVPQGEVVSFAVGQILVANSDLFISSSEEGLVVPKEAPSVPSDTKPPIFNYQVNDRTITLTAIDETQLHESPYSFNGGKTWTSERVFVVKEGENKEFAVDEIKVRDASENINSNKEIINVPVKVVDTTAPTMAVVVDGAVLTVIADDDIMLHQAPYSYDNGKTWNVNNKFVLEKGEKTFNVGDVQVRDFAGNITKSNNVYNLKVEVFTTSAMIDVSSYQGVIDWKKVADSGIKYAIIRATTWSGSASTGYWAADAMFETNVKNAKANEIEVGAYIYTYAYSYEDANNEMAVFIALAKKLHSQGYYFDLPVVIDYEWNTILSEIPSIDVRTNLLKYQMDLLDWSGYYPAMYMSTSWATYNVNARVLQDKGYDLWIADYTQSAINNGTPGYNYNIVAWQYTGSGSVDGIVGNVDLNYLYKDYSSIILGSDNGGQVIPETTITVYDVNTRKNVTDTRTNIIAAVVNNEVGNIYLTGLDREKMYKAQAVAASSWLQFRFENQNTIPAVGLKYDGNFTLVKTQIESVKNYYLTYNGRAANTFYGSSTNGKTNTPKDYWLAGGDYPYLTIVDSPYDVNVPEGATDYQNVIKTSSVEHVKQKILSLGGNPTGDPSTWIKITSRNPISGYVTGVTVGGKAISPSTFYEYGFGAISPDFTVTYKNGAFEIVSNGFGHGIGMSQFGAAGYIAKEGKSWEEILQIYYPSTVLKIVL